VGTWGIGLYSGDYAQDLRTTLAALARLPFDGDRILGILRELEPPACDPSDEEYTTFWLVVADQFHKRGIACPQAVETAMRIIDDGSDDDMFRRRRMNATDLAKRRRKLAALRAQLAGGSVRADRRTLRKPQAYCMDTGEVFVYPTSRYTPLNPYLKRREDNYRAPFNWVHDGWSAMVLLNRGRAFDYLAWYAIAVLDDTYPHKPSMEQLLAHHGWVVTPPATCSANQLRRMDVEKIGQVQIDREASARFRPAHRSCVSAAASDISLAGRMKARPVKTSKGPWPMIDRLADVLV
jgi:hypothetical protein